MGKTRAAPGRGPHRTRRSPLQEGARREGQRGGGQWGGLAGGQRGRAAGSVTCVLITQEVMAAGGGVRAPQADLGFRGHSGCSVRRPRWGAGGMTAVSQGPAAWATLVAMQEVGLAAVRPSHFLTPAFSLDLVTGVSFRKGACVVLQVQLGCRPHESCICAEGALSLQVLGPEGESPSRAASFG